MPVRVWQCHSGATAARPLSFSRRRRRPAHAQREQTWWGERDVYGTKYGVRTEIQLQRAWLAAWLAGCDDHCVLVDLAGSTILLLFTISSLVFYSFNRLSLLVARLPAYPPLPPCGVYNLQYPPRKHPRTGLAWLPAPPELSLGCPLRRLAVPSASSGLQSQPVVPSHPSISVLFKASTKQASSPPPT